MVTVSRDHVVESIGRLRCLLDRLEFNASGLPPDEGVELVIPEGENPDLPTFLLLAENYIDRFTDALEATLREAVEVGA